MNTLLTWVVGLAAGAAFVWLAEPRLKRHPLAACWVYGALTAVLAAGAAGNAVLHQWGWAALQVPLAFACAYSCLKYWTRRKLPEMTP